jgi:3-oxoacyl-[acyl-carrier protein] reductase
LHRIIGKTALVVGGGRGLGRCIALALSREGADVVVAARTKSEIDEVAEEVRKLGRRALAVKTDVVDYEQVLKMVQETLNEFGKIEILVNCQGESLVKPTVETKLEELDLAINTNLKSVFYTCLAVLPSMLKQKNGHIINMSSLVGVEGAAKVAAYTAAKAGVIGLSQSLALELKSENIKVNVICPAPMDTSMRWKATPDFDRKKVIRPETVAELVVLLVSWDDCLVQQVIIPASINYTREE